MYSKKEFIFFRKILQNFIKERSNNANQIFVLM